MPAIRMILRPNEQHMQLELMREFAHKHNLPREGKVVLEQSAAGDEYLTIEHPVVLARFISFIKGRNSERGYEVYLRGQSRQFPGMLPGLYRGSTNSGDRDLRWTAYKAMLNAFREILPGGRFHRNNPGALLQHYGIRTPWLDLVDNIYVALWFASHDCIATSESTAAFRKRDEGHGWVYLVSNHAPGRPPLTVIDLRKQHSSLSVRPHAQHALSIARQTDVAQHRFGSDFSHYVCGIVRFPLGRRWSLGGSMAQPQYMFPNHHLDSSLSILSEPKYNELIQAVEVDFGLAAGVLGRIFKPQYRPLKDPGSWGSNGLGELTRFSPAEAHRGKPRIDEG